jgi:hypothetical protein
VKVKRCKSAFRFKQRGKSTVRDWQMLGDGTEEGREKKKKYVKREKNK